MPSAQAPNLLVILCDQLRRGAVGCYGDPNVATPQLDRLAAEGVVFQNACSTYPICVPFRFTLQTGEYAHTRFVPGIEYRLSPAERTLADEFNEAGYDTLYVGKWHLHGGHGVLPGHPCRKANRTWIPPRFQGRWRKWLGFEVANNPFETWYFEDGDPSPRLLKGYQTDGLFDLALGHLARRGVAEQPFCCLLSVEPPHFPLLAPPGDMERWSRRDLSLHPNFLIPDPAPAPGKKVQEKDRPALLANLRAYYAMLENLDWNIGRMREFLEATGLDERTVIVFLSDHGQMDGAHAHGSTQKYHPYEESIGIPLLVRDPRLSQRRGTRLADPVCSEDLFPTLLGLAGLAPRDPKPGMDLAPLVRGQQQRLGREGVLLEFVHDLRPWHPYHEVAWRGFRSERFKYTVLGGAEAGGLPWQFFDLARDPHELENLIAAPAHREEVARHHRLMRQRMLETDDHYVLAPAWGSAGLNIWD